MMDDTPDIEDVAAALLAAGVPIVRVAEQVNRHERTVRKWLDDPAFRKRVDAIRTATVQEAVGGLVGSMSSATAELRRLVAEGTDDKVRLGASKALLDLALRARAAEEIEAKVEELAARLDAVTTVKGKK